MKQQQLSDLSEFLRRRGDIEAEYARALEKLTERFTHKTKKYVATAQVFSFVWRQLIITSVSVQEGAMGSVCLSGLVRFADSDSSGEP